MISPTGLGIRVDSEGSGIYAARRGARRHNGVDYRCKDGQDIVAPFDMRIDRIAYPNRDMTMRGVAWSTERSRGKMFYFEPDRDLVGAEVEEGQVIGTAQSVSRYYGLPKMMDHIHFQVDK